MFTKTAGIIIEIISIFNKNFINYYFELSARLHYRRMRFHPFRITCDCMCVCVFTFTTSLARCFYRLSTQFFVLIQLKSFLESNLILKMPKMVIKKQKRKLGSVSKAVKIRGKVSIASSHAFELFIIISIPFLILIKSYSIREIVTNQIINELINFL